MSRCLQCNGAQLSGLSHRLPTFDRPTADSPFHWDAFFTIRELSKLGVKVTYKQGTLTEIHQCLTNNYPCIVAVQTEQLPYWNYTHSHHVIVAIGIDSEFIYVNDPEFAGAPIAVRLGDFDLAWLEQDEYYAVLGL